MIIYNDDLKEFICVKESFLKKHNVLEVKRENALEVKRENALEVKRENVQDSLLDTKRQPKKI